MHLGRKWGRKGHTTALNASIRYYEIEAACLLLSWGAVIEEEWIKKIRQYRKNPGLYIDILLAIEEQKKVSLWRPV